MQHISKVKAIKRSHANKLGPVGREREREGEMWWQTHKSHSISNLCWAKRKVKPYKFVRKLGQAKPTTKCRCLIVVNKIKFWIEQVVQGKIKSLCVKRFLQKTQISFILNTKTVFRNQVILNGFFFRFPLAKLHIVLLLISSNFTMSCSAVFKRKSRSRHVVPSNSFHYVAKWRQVCFINTFAAYVRMCVCVFWL